MLPSYQVVASDFDGMMADAQTLLTNIDKDVFIKVPTSETGLNVIKELKRQGTNVTATAIYTKFQAYLAIASGADYIAPYYNRMENLNINPNEAIKEMANEIERTFSSTKILAASFKNVGQVNAALENGSNAATMDPDIFKTALLMPSIHPAVEDFKEDWEDIYGNGSTIGKS